MKGDKTLAKLTQQFDVYSNRITEWKKQLQERMADVFETGKTAVIEPVVGVKVLHTKIDQLSLKNDFFRRSAKQGGLAKRKAMIDHAHALPIARPARLAAIV